MSTDIGSQPPPEAPVVAPLAAIDELLLRYGLQRVGEPDAIAASVLNDNYRVETTDGPRFLRVHKKTRAVERLHLEHQVIGWAGAHGIPVNPPEADAQGRTLHSIGGSSLALFPWLDAVHLERGHIGLAGAATLGAMQGQIHRTFAHYDGPPLPHGGTGATWDTDESIAVLSRVDDLIRYYPAHSEWTLAIQDGLRAQLELLESPEARPCGDFAGLAAQALHGDYHERNVLLNDDGSVAAVVDWEMPTVIPPVYELLRCLTFAHLLDAPLLEAYLRGYRQEFALRSQDCEAGVEMWWQECIHNTWSYRARYIEGNRRVDQFFAEGRATIARFRDPAYRASLAADLHCWAT